MLSLEYPCTLLWPLPKLLVIWGHGGFIIVIFKRALIVKKVRTGSFFQQFVLMLPKMFSAWQSPSHCPAQGGELFLSCPELCELSSGPSSSVLPPAQRSRATLVPLPS